MDWEAEWIKPKREMGEAVPAFCKRFVLEKKILSATLSLTGTGVYEAVINDRRVSTYVLAPGWTEYYHRLQYQCYDVTELLDKENTLEVSLGKGWYRGRIGWFDGGPDSYQGKLRRCPGGILAQLCITYQDGTVENIGTGEDWTVKESPIRFSEIYDGERYDATFAAEKEEETECFEGPWDTLIPQEGEEIMEQERIAAARMLVTPEGDTVLDFGQEVTGYVEIFVMAKQGEEVRLSFAEVLDKNGNFYNENYRTAKSEYYYRCRDGAQTYHPHLTFYGFRYVRIDAFPGGISKAAPENFTAIAVYSKMKRTGYLRSSDAMLNRLFENVIWGQRGNFLDVPTDCPQRDERCGWTGDAQVFIKTAALNYDVEKFFTKWLADMAAGQQEDGKVGHVVPDLLKAPQDSAAWGDAATVCPWELYLAYGNKEILQRQYECMERWVGYITASTTEPDLWIGGTHYGDWLGLDAPYGSYKGSSRDDLIASAFYAHSTDLLIRTGKVLGKNVSLYERMYCRIVEKFRRTFPTYETQTECILAVQFQLAEDPQKTADFLAEKIIACGKKMETGFVGTPYLLHVLSDYGHKELAYELLLRREYPSWLYPVTKGATTVWEHWDGIREDGAFWSADMNSFNHYAYGSVADWVYTKAAGIQTVEEHPGYEKVRIAPQPSTQLCYLEAELETRHGKIRSRWEAQGKLWRYEIMTPVPAEIVIGDHRMEAEAGSYCFYSERI